MNNLKSYFKKIDNLSHAFLIGNVVFDEIEKDLEEIVEKRIMFKDSINLRENPDIYYYDQDEKLIKKEEIKELLENLSITSQISNSKIYIINGSEKLSDVVANAILKTLEEPASNIYAFLITKNVDSVKETIKSRCQKIIINSSNYNKKYDEKESEIADYLIKSIENNNIKSIALNADIYNKIESREMFKKIMEILLDKYNNILNIIIANDTNYKENSEIILNNDIITLSKKLLVINNFQELLDNYLNKNSIIDRFIIEMWRCNK
ncbi:MAG: hypothetical protein IJK67_03120 [Bacilli bacterium]|nr:hypothetical protein [Bacilli bacterium]